VKSSGTAVEAVNEDVKPLTDMVMNDMLTTLSAEALTNEPENDPVAVVLVKDDEKD